MRFRHFFKAAALLLLICSKATFATNNNSPIKKDNSSKNTLGINSGKTSMGIAPPQITAVGNQIYCPLTYVKIATSVTITHDPADTGASSVDIQISSGYIVGQDQLSLSVLYTNPNIKSTWIRSEGKLILSSTTGGLLLYSEFETAIKNVEYYNYSLSPSGIRNFSINLGIGGANYLPRNGHFYEFVPNVGITWSNANTAASSKSYYGLQGYLATVTAADEAQLSGAQARGAGWIGGSDARVEGLWRWVTGPEGLAYGGLGTVFWYGTGGGSTPNFAFWNTMNNEPNQAGDEDFAHITAPGVGVPGSWNDLSNTGDLNPGSPYQPKGYIVEYGGMPGDPTLQISTSTIITIPQINSTTSNSRCGSGTVTLDATATNGSVYWYTTSIGGSPITSGNTFTTPIITTTTIYYVDATGNCPSTPRTQIIATINPIPAITSTTANSRCHTGTVTLGAGASAGTINWYDTPTAGSLLGTGRSFTTPSIATTTIYYVDATATGCTTATRTAITATVKISPSITSITPASRCETGTLILKAVASAGTINWYDVQTGGSSLGTGTSYTTPSISTTTIYYVDAKEFGCTTPTRTAIKATINTPPTIISTIPNSRCYLGTLILGATASSGTVNWYDTQTGGTSLGTGASYTTQSITTTTMYYVDATAFGCTTPTRTAITATVISPSINSTTPASRCDTGTITLGAVASAAGALNWYDVQTGGSSLGTGTSFTTPSISTTTTYYVDTTASGCTTTTRTAIVATVNSSPSITSTTPASRCDTGSVTLGAIASSGIINWYNVLTGGTSLGTGNSFTTPSLTSSTTYYVDSVGSLCITPTRTAITATINIPPSITLTTLASRCETGTIILGAVASSGNINWYDVQTGGTSLGTGTSFTTPNISASTTYYVDATANGCTIATRTAIIATVNSSPSITSTTPGYGCDLGTVILGATASSGTINWYDVPTGGTLLGTGTSFTTPSISSTTTYYVDTTNQCTSPRVAVVATVYPVLSINEEVILCQNETTILDASISGMNYLWSPGGETSQTIVVSTIGNYNVIISSPSIVCYSNKYINVIELPAPIINAIIVKENFVTIELTNQENYYEFSIDGVIFQNSNQFSYITSGIHTAYVREKNLCNLVTQDFIILTIAKYFTPNSDGFNDVWEITVMKDFPRSSALIFDRYGKLLITLNALQYSWDGKYNNNILPADDYWYCLKLDDSKPEIKGHFSLKR